MVMHHLLLSESDIKKLLSQEWHSAKNCHIYLKCGSKNLIMFICDPYTYQYMAITIYEDRIFDSRPI